MPVVPKGAGPELRDHPVGTGPYQFVSFAVDDQLELTAFPGYFGGAPANDGVVLKVVPDEIMRALELRKGTRRHGRQRPVARRRPPARRGTSR